MSAESQKIAILGAGLSGFAAARLAGQDGSKAVVLDSGDPQKLAPAKAKFEEMGVEATFGPEAEAFSESVDLVVQSPGIDLASPIVRQFEAKGIPVIGEVEYAFRHVQPGSFVVAITGTNGKTTTTEMIDEIYDHTVMKCVATGNYGVPFCEAVLHGTAYNIYSLEVSSFQMESIETFRPTVSIWLNFAPDHLDRYAGIEDYFEAKRRIFEFQTADDVAVIKNEDREKIGKIAARVITFSAYDSEADYSFDGTWICHEGKRIFDFSATKLRGTHNAENVMAAIAATMNLGEVEMENVVQALSNYQPPAHRCELVGEIDGHEFINDSKATNLHALESSLRGQIEPIVLIAGGKDKGLDFGEITDLVAEKVSQVILIGQMADRIAETWGAKVPCTTVETLESAVEESLKVARPKQAILFSPGTSSFDMFGSYGERGDVFREAVRELSSVN
ncbi:MAG: UDP-N-acetylmuramoyl-L-alanine--D-glutamate ligase [Verrucomicrobiota bacterium]